MLEIAGTGGGGVLLPPPPQPTRAAPMAAKTKKPNRSIFLRTLVFSFSALKTIPLVLVLVPRQMPGQSFDSVRLVFSTRYENFGTEDLWRSNTTSGRIHSNVIA